MVIEIVSPSQPQRAGCSAAAPDSSSRLGVGQFFLRHRRQVRHPAIVRLSCTHGALDASGRAAKVWGEPLSIVVRSTGAVAAKRRMATPTLPSCAVTVRPPDGSFGWALSSPSIAVQPVAADTVTPVPGVTAGAPDALPPGDSVTSPSADSASSVASRPIAVSRLGSVGGAGSEPWIAR